MAHQENTDLQKKENFYRGKSLDELKAMDVRESAKYLPAGSRRSVLRKFDVIEKFIQRSEVKMARKKKIKTHQRDLVIVPKMVGMAIQIHNGKAFQEVTITSEMIGHRLGEFALTRVKATHTTMGLGATKSSRAKKK